MVLASSRLAQDNDLSRKGAARLVQDTVAELFVWRLVCIIVARRGGIL